MSEPSRTRKILTLEEVSDRTRIPLNTLRYLRANRRGPRLWKLTGSGRLVAFEDDVEAYLEECYQATVTKPVA